MNRCILRTLQVVRGGENPQCTFPGLFLINAVLYFLPLTLQDSFQSSWLKDKAMKLATLGLSLNDLLGEAQARGLIKQRIEDTEQQKDIASSSTFLAPNYLQIIL